MKATDQFWDELKLAWLKNLDACERNLKSSLGRAMQYSHEAENLAQRSRRQVEKAQFWFNEMLYAQNCVVACLHRDPKKMPQMPESDDTAEIVPHFQVVPGGKQQ